MNKELSVEKIQCNKMCKNCKDICILVQRLILLKKINRLTKNYKINKLNKKKVSCEYRTI